MISDIYIPVFFEYHRCSNYSEHFRCQIISAGGIMDFEISVAGYYLL
ncbi:MAG: hypothetical protein ACFFG0_45985 [Candidatus Thorarchaeota archaeon]